MVNGETGFVLIECDVPTRVFIEKVDRDLREAGRGGGDVGKTSLIRETLDETHLLVSRSLLEPLQRQIEERNRENTFTRDQRS